MLALEARRRPALVGRPRRPGEGGDQPAGARSAADPAVRPATGQAGLPVGPRRRADPNHPQAVRGRRTAQRRARHGPAAGTARPSLSDGHRVIDGVAGSGKTLILACRAQHVARTFTPPPDTFASGAARSWSPSAQMVDSANNSLLLDDDALSLYGRRRPAGDLAACDLTAANRSQPWRIGPIRKPFARADFNSLCWFLTAGSRTSSDRCVLRDPRSSRWHVRAIAAPIRDHRRQSPLEPR